MTLALAVTVTIGILILINEKIAVEQYEADEATQLRRAKHAKRQRKMHGRVIRHPATRKEYIYVR